MNRTRLLPVLLLPFAMVATAAPIDGEIVTFQSPNGITEECIRIAPMPGAHYSKKDKEAESKFCGLDLYRLALCPKLWSTSPGTILYEIDLEAHGGSPGASLPLSPSAPSDGHRSERIPTSGRSLNRTALSPSGHYCPPAWSTPEPTNDGSNPSCKNSPSTISDTGTASTPPVGPTSRRGSSVT